MSGEISQNIDLGEHWDVPEKSRNRHFCRHVETKNSPEYFDGLITQMEAIRFFGAENSFP